MKKYAMLSLMAVLALGACDDDDPVSPNTAQVRIVNATTGASFATIHAFRGNTEIVSAIAAGNASVCTTTYSVPAGTQTINFRTTAGGATNHESIENFNFQANHRYTVVVYGTNADIRAMVVDDGTVTDAPANQRRLRFINASVSNTAGDVYARANTTGPPTPPATVSNIAAGTAGTVAGSNYVNVANTNNFFQFFNTGTTANVRVTYDATGATFPTSGNATIYFTDTNAFKVNNCT